MQIDSASNYVRIAANIEPTQRDKLKELHATTGIPQQRFIRMALDRLLATIDNEVVPLKVA